MNGCAGFIRAGILTLAFFLAPVPTTTAGNFGLNAALAEESAKVSPEALKKAESFIDRLGTKALDSLVGSGITKEERAKRFKVLLNENFDLETLGRFALGRYWRMATESEKKEYTRLFEKMVVDVYSNRFEEYSGQTLAIKGSMAVGKNDIIVQSDLVHPDNKAKPVTLEWRVRYKDGGYKIVDVIVAGISMSVTQRSDFAAVIEKGGGKVEALLVSLKERKNGKEGEKSPEKAASKAKKDS